MPKKTFFLIFSLTLVATCLIAISLVSLNLNEQAPTETKIPTPTSDPVQATLEILKPEIATTSAKSYIANVLIDTGGNIKTNNIQLELLYDPAVLSNMDIKAGDFFENPNLLLKKIDTKNGRLSYALSEQSSTSGSGVFAIISFTKMATKSAALTKIEIMPKTKVSSPDYSQSILKSSVSIEF